MASDYTFDVVSETDLQAVDDAVNAANKEISVRFDFRGSVSKLEFDKGKSLVTINSDDEGKLKSVIEIFKSRMAKRNVEQKAIELLKLETALGGKVRQQAKINQGISTEKAKAIVADIKKEKIKVTASIQSDKVRISSKSKDLLQQVMAFLQSKDYGIPLQFNNFR